ncbi:hypothetical protein D6D06_06542 [Aureobasidium pullulans]|nr:hypothetical protein D6D06_06542 [Aureobasidium pullulans]
MVTVQDADPSLLGMPTEVLSMIVGLAGSEAFPALRLTNKYLCAVANKPFATLHFSERKHVQSLHSMDALVEITAHAFFAIFVKKVIVSASRPEPESPEVYRVTCRWCTRPLDDRRCVDPAPRHLPLATEQFREKLDAVFSNIARTSHSVFIGICGDPLGCYGSKGYATCVDLVQDSQQSTDHSELHFLSYCLGKTFGQIQEATQKSGCEIQGVKIELLGRILSDLRYRYLKSDIDALMKRLVVSLSKPLSLDLSLESCKHVEQLKYDHKTGAMDLSGLEFGSRFLNYTGHLGDVLSCLSASRMTVINIQDWGLSAQLKALGETVAQMEVDKIAEIRRDGFIRTDIIGIPKDVESDEDEEEAEDGDENEVAGQIEEESEGNDDDDEYEDED